MRNISYSRFCSFAIVFNIYEKISIKLLVKDKGFIQESRNLIGIKITPKKRKKMINVINLNLKLCKFCSFLFRFTHGFSAAKGTINNVIQ